MYKPSFYNNFQQIDGSMLGYNSFNDNFLLLEHFTYDLFQAAIHEDQIQEIESVHPSFFKELLEKGFIVEKDRNELQEVREYMKLVDGDDSFYTIIINPTMNCNFSCWYCYEDHVKGSKMSEETIQSVYKLMDRVVADKNIETLNLSWFGGEPLLYYKQVMQPLLEYANKVTKENNMEFNSDITTNGMLITDAFIEDFKKNNLDYFQVTIDGNKEKHDTIRFVNKKRGSYDEIMKNVVKLCENDITVNLRINYTEETLRNITDILVDLDKISRDKLQFLTVDFHQVWQTKVNVDGDFKQLIYEIYDTFEGAGYTVQKNNASGITESCYADKTNEVVINYNGDLFKCTARDFTKANSLGTLNTDGTLTWGGKLEVRQNSKLNNAPCQECTIFPQCGTGCSQVVYEANGEDFCVYEFDESKKQEMIKDHFYDTVGIESEV